MPLDPEVQKWLDQAATVGVPSFDQLSVEHARQFMLMSSLPLDTGEQLARIEDLTMPGPGGPLPLRLYDPGGPVNAARPVILFYHGGGWVVGSIATHDAYCRSLANAVGAMVVSVDYRLAPEHRFPAAVEDAYAALVWVASHAPEFGGDATRLAVAGDSAGGNLAAVSTLMARDRNGPRVRSQVLIYPIVDYSFDTDSYLRNMAGYHLTRDTMIWFWDHYLPDQSQRSQPYASPLRATDLTGLPPALIITAEYDPLLDEGEVYARRLRAAGVPVQLSRYPGTIHGFARRMKLWQHARDCLAEIAGALRAAFAEPAALQQSGTGAARP